MVRFFGLALLLTATSTMAIDIRAMWDFSKPAVSEERSVATDRATLAFRRWYLERKKRGPSETTALTEAPPLAS